MRDGRRRPRSAASSAATSRWTATRAGTASQQAYDVLVHGRGAHQRRRAGRARCAPPTSAARRTSSSSRRWSATEARIRPGDSVIAFNFRPDRMREITCALAEPAFAEVDRGGAPPVERYTCMTEYHEGWPYPVAFPPERPAVTLSHVLADRGATQLHVAETEKYPHVTYFFNGGEEAPYAGERRELVPSPRDVPTYDHKPQMSAPRGGGGVRARVAARTSRASAIINFANADMVGHTGVIPAAVTAVETVDAASARSSRRSTRPAARCIITADHGNADHMLEPDGSPEHRALAQPGAADRHRPGPRAARRRDPRRRRADRAEDARREPARRDDGHVARHALLSSSIPDSDDLRWNPRSTSIRTCCGAESPSSSSSLPGTGKKIFRTCSRRTVSMSVCICDRVTIAFMNA